MCIDNVNYIVNQLQPCFTSRYFHLTPRFLYDMED
jgi:hypothetical protein